MILQFLYISSSKLGLVFEMSYQYSSVGSEPNLVNWKASILNVDSFHFMTVLVVLVIKCAAGFQSQ